MNENERFPFGRNIRDPQLRAGYVRMIALRVMKILTRK